MGTFLEDFWEGASELLTSREVNEMVHTLHLAFGENSTEERHKAKKGRRSKKSVKWIED